VPASRLQERIVKTIYFSHRLQRFHEVSPHVLNAQFDIPVADG
jgi:hypothetical protein